MAKSKHSVALFEVIHSGRTPRRSIRELLRTPKWWFHSKQAGGTRPAEPPPAPEPAPMADEQVQSTAPAPQVPGIDLKIDPERQRIRFNLTYTSAIVAGFALFVVVGLAYVIGSRGSGGPETAMGGPTSEQLRQGPARPAVLDVKPGSPVKAAPAPEREDAITANPSQSAPAAAAAVQTAQRIIGRNYVVAQSYPDEEDAKEACELLNRNGIPATIERGLTGFPSSWYIVVGLAGFDRMGNNPEFDRYIKSIIALNDLNKSKPKFKRFEPLAVKWKG